MTPANDDPLRALQHDVRRLRRCLRVQSAMIAILLILNVVAPVAVVMSR